jgi:hypothetical protein
MVEYLSLPGLDSGRWRSFWTHCFGDRFAVDFALRFLPTPFLRRTPVTADPEGSVRSATAPSGHFQCVNAKWPEIVAQYPELNETQVSARLFARWKSPSDWEKQAYNVPQTGRMKRRSPKPV